ncbi:hypothetical protein B0J11DRAFT_158409 [Dendryphion nanum]|uniref:Uncharacterized protein n=1 Tax=Dendryphion nanum TaxID=256645 RepID=A0A9P9ED11_9PLEO|nr:hypothetical protein B0J11DRAFT_158409 [Dendryphion nanum]
MVSVLYYTILAWRDCNPGLSLLSWSCSCSWSGTAWLWHGYGMTTVLLPTQPSLWHSNAISNQFTNQAMYPQGESELSLSDCCVGLLARSSPYQLSMSWFRISLSLSLLRRKIQNTWSLHIHVHFFLKQACIHPPQQPISDDSICDSQRTACGARHTKTSSTKCIVHHITHLFLSIDAFLADHIQPHPLHCLNDHIL